MVWQRWPYTVTVETAGVGVDEYGNPIPSAFTSSTIRGDVQPVTTDETRDGVSDIASDEVRFYFPAGTVVGSTDRLTVGTDTYEALGPDTNRDTGSTLDYVRIRARRTN
jgi:hypothetical protein